MIKYGFIKEVARPFEQALAAVKKALADNGFGVLTEIPIHEKLKEKLGVDFRRYVILGACNPPNAHQALLAEENIGLLLPCNVIVYEKGGGAVVGVIKPTVAMQSVDNPALAPVAMEVEKKLKAAFDSIS